MSPRMPPRRRACSVCWMPSTKLTSSSRCWSLGAKSMPRPVTPPSVPTSRATTPSISIVSPELGWVRLTSTRSPTGTPLPGTAIRTPVWLTSRVCPAMLSPSPASMRAATRATTRGERRRPGSVSAASDAPAALRRGSSTLRTDWIAPSNCTATPAVPPATGAISGVTMCTISPPRASFSWQKGSESTTFTCSRTSQASSVATNTPPLTRLLPYSRSKTSALSNSTRRTRAKPTSHGPSGHRGVSAAPRPSLTGCREGLKKRT